MNLPRITNSDQADEKTRAFLKKHPLAEEHHPLLKAIYGNSPYLGTLIDKNPEYVSQLVTQDPQDLCNQTIEQLKTDSQNITTEAECMMLLRQAKQKIALLTAIGDITEIWTLDQVTKALSKFAEVSLNIALNKILHDAANKGDLAPAFPDNPSRKCGFIVLAVGKLGGKELNYSSDIDLILFYDKKKLPYTGKKTIQHFTVECAKRLINIMQERTADGYVFRMDLRLRPDPGSMPLAISTVAAMTYYESVGQNWERMALIKARPVAGDLTAGRNVIKGLVPFIWRKYLDFAMIEDIVSVKRQIESKYNVTSDQLYGYNIKLGHGGIREIEFFTSIQQLIWGGRERILRSVPTCKSLKNLVACKKVKESTVKSLIEIYYFLRKLEHRLQMINDQQTHTLGKTEQDMYHIACFMGYAHTEGFIKDLEQKLQTVQEHYRNLYAASPSLGSGTGSLVFTGTEEDPETVENIRKLGFEHPEAVSSTIRSWHHGRIRATRNKRARELLTELVPSILKALGKTSHPDTAFRKFDEFLSKVPSGLQLFSLFMQHVDLLNIIGEIMGCYPYLANNLSRYPSLIDYILSHDFLDPLRKRDVLREHLEQLFTTAENYEQILNIARRWAHDRQFRVGVQLIKKLITTEQAERALSDIAETVLGKLLEYVEEEFTQKHGTITGGEFSILAMGKLGSRSLSFGSDIDLIFIYNVDDMSSESDGDAPLTATEYYARLSRRYISAFSALTVEGKLYDIDMRLRPSGNDGPMATSLETFEKYYTEKAWTWEYMALTRARVIAGSHKMRQHINQVIKETLTRPRDEVVLATDVTTIRAKIEQQYGSFNIWDIKYVQGGLIDLEFIAQFLQLKHAHKHPDILNVNTKRVFSQLIKEQIITEQEGQKFTEAITLFLSLQSLLRLASDNISDRFFMSEAIKQELVRLTDYSSFEEIEQTLTNTQQQVNTYFKEKIQTRSGT